MLQRCLLLLAISGCILAAAWGWGLLRRSTETGDFAGLDLGRQREIWDAEHVTFEIETYVAKPFVDALKKRDQERMETLLLPGFSGSVPSQQAVEQPIAQSGVAEETIEVRDPISVDRSGFVSYLLTILRPIESPQSGRLRVLKIRRHDASSPRWHLEVLLHLEGLGRSGQLIEYESTGQMEVLVEGDAQVRSGEEIVASWSIAQQTLRGAEGTLFEEVTQRAGLDRIPIPDNWQIPLDRVRQYVAQYAVEDADLDGDLDIAAATADGDCLLFRQEQGRFVEVSGQVGITPERDLDLRSYLAHWIDVDADGFPDLLLGSRLYRNLSGQRFEEFPDNAGLRIKFNPMGATVADFDADGHQDLYVLYQRELDPQRDTTPSWVGDDDSGALNQLWRNLGEGRFRNVTSEARAAGGSRHTFAAAWLHANEDILPDLYIANDFGGNTLLINSGGGQFEDVSETANVADFATSMGVAAGDIDDDGRSDIYVANMFSKMGRRIIAQVGPQDYPDGIHDQLLGSCAGNRLYSVRDGQYREISERLGINQVGWAYAPAFLDVDGDSDLDIYATCGFLSFDRHKPDG